MLLGNSPGVIAAITSIPAESRPGITPPSLSINSTLSRTSQASSTVEIGAPTYGCHPSSVSRGLSRSTATIASPVPLPTQPDNWLRPPVAPQPCALKIAAAGAQCVQHRFEIPSRQRYLEAPRAFKDTSPIRRRSKEETCTVERKCWCQSASDRQVPAAVLSPDTYLPSILPPVCQLERRVPIWCLEYWPGEPVSFSALNRLVVKQQDA